MAIIRRHELVTMTEQALEAAPSLAYDERYALRHVALTADYVAYGEWHLETASGVLCDCPLSAAGLADHDTFMGSGSEGQATPAQRAFYTEFDQKAAGFSYGPKGVLQVVPDDAKNFLDFA